MIEDTTYPIISSSSRSIFCSYKINSMFFSLASVSLCLINENDYLRDATVGHWTFVLFHRCRATPLGGMDQSFLENQSE